MENGAHNGITPTNHDRDLSRINGVNGTSPVKREPSPEKQKAAPAKDLPSRPALNGSANMETKQEGHSPDVLRSAEERTRMNDLPDDVPHVTDNFIPLSFLLSRLAQRSHNALQEKIIELAHKPLPAAAVNGAADTHGLDSDESAANLDKKRTFLNFIQNEHSNWVKALVITEWSKKAEQVSKLIDLRGFLMGQMQTHDNSMANLMDLKRNLTFARLPSPDLKTALQVLSDGDVPWLAELDYVAPPAVDPREQLKWMDNINTLLSLRLNLEDHDKIPYHFREYSIGSGRVTFKVKGEFEVDLTIADEDFEKQLWFIDFRFCFSPAPAEPSEGLRTFLEGKVNDILGSEGLAGCYKFLHEYVLTHKINELRRQALELRQGRWVDTLKVESLNRALAIQYWASRYPRDNLKSWIIVGVHSGKKAGVIADERSTSHLSIRWFRDNVEVKDAVIPFDTEEISTETLLKVVIARHTEHILSTIHAKLLSRPLFAKRHAAMRLHISRMEPMDSYLQVQMTYLDKAIARIDPVTGFFAMGPHNQIVAKGEQHLNNLNGRDPAEDGLNVLDGIRCFIATEELNRRAKSFGWIATRSPVKPDALRSVLNTRDKYQTAWYKRQDWDSKWQVMVSLSLGGDRWFLMEMVNSQSGPSIGYYVPLPLNPAQPNLQDPFFANFNIFVSAIISQITDVRDLRAKRINNFPGVASNPYLSSRMRLPVVNVSLAQLLSYNSGNPEEPLGKKPWALNTVQILFKGVSGQPSSGSSRAGSGRRNAVLAEARIVVTDRRKFSLLQGKVDHDVAFNHQSGQFCLTLRAEMGKSVVDMLRTRLQAIVRLVDFLDNIRKGSQGIECETVTLRQVVFTYGTTPALPGAAEEDLPPAVAAAAEPKKRRWRVVLDLAAADGIEVELEKGNPHLRIHDLLRRTVNNPSTFGALPAILCLTLPILTALDGMDDRWAAVAAEGKGSLTVLPRAADWFGVRFVLLPAAAGTKRQLDLSVRLRLRGAKRWWYVARRQEQQQQQGGEVDDEFGRALRRVWDGSGGAAWSGLGTGAVGEPEGGVELLLGEVDEAVRALVGTPPPPRPPPPAPVAAPTAPVAPMQQPPPQQQGKPAQKRSQAKAKGNNNIKPDVVDLT